MSREYTGHWSRVAATVTLVSAGWEPLRVGSPKPQVPSCPSRSDPRKPEVSPPPARASGTVGSPGWVRGPGAAPSWAPAAPAAPSRRRSARTRVGHSGARERRPPGRDAGPRGGAVRWGGAERRQLPGNSNPGSSGAAAPAQPLHSPRSEVSAGAGRAPGAARGSRRGSAAGGTAVPARQGAVPPAAPTFQHRAEFVQGHCLPAAAAISGAPWPRRCPPRGRCARGSGSAPARPRPCPAPPRGALSLRRPSAEPPPRSVPSRAGRGGLRRGWPAPGGSPRGSRSTARQLPARLKRLLLNEAHLRCEGCLPG